MSVPFSVLMAVYRGDSPDHLLRAVRSVTQEQTLRPDELVLVQDGPVPIAVEEAIASAVSGSPVPVRLVRSDKNEGLAGALQRGLQVCRHDVIARMDADDVALSERFEKQLEEFERRALDLLGTAMFEFLDEEGTVIGRRVPPTGQTAISSYARFHDPFNHPTVIYRRSAVLRAGGYQPMGLMEDYWLFARMLLTGATADNLSEPLIMYRVGSGAYQRRGGVGQLKAEWRLQREFRKIGFTSSAQWCRNVLVRCVYRLVPTVIRRFAYRAIIARNFRVR